MTATATTTRADRITTLRSAVAAERRGETLPPDLQADLQALRTAGLAFTITPTSTLTPPPKPARELAADEVTHLDARDPRRAMYLYQSAYARLGRPVPQAAIDNLRAAARDEQARQQARRSLASPPP